MKHTALSRRGFLRQGVILATALQSPWVWAASASDERSSANPRPAAPAPSTSKVAIVACRSYGPELRQALDQSFDLLGGLRHLVRGKTVTVKVNLTGTNFGNLLDHSPGETYMTHYATAVALTASLFGAGASRVRLVESTNSRAPLEATLAMADWDVKALRTLGKVEFENTRNLGTSKSYSQLRVPNGGHMFSSFQVNRAYEDTDVMVSLAKLKNHVTAGVTLSMKNMFGMTPNALYGDDAGNEDATGGRGPLHERTGSDQNHLPGLKPAITSNDATWRVPHIVADECAARPIHLAIIDGITSISGGEGPWCPNLKFTTPGLIISGLNAVSTDAVGTAVMGYANPRAAARTSKPFDFCDNHLLLAEQDGCGTADLRQIEILGLELPKARYRYA